MRKLKNRSIIIIQVLILIYYFIIKRVLKINYKPSLELDKVDYIVSVHFHKY